MMEISFKAVENVEASRLSEYIRQKACFFVLFLQLIRHLYIINNNGFCTERSFVHFIRGGWDYV